MEKLEKNQPFDSLGIELERNWKKPGKNLFLSLRCFPFLEVCSGKTDEKQGKLESIRKTRVKMENSLKANNLKGKNPENFGGKLGKNCGKSSRTLEKVLIYGKSEGNPRKGKEI